MRCRSRMRGGACRTPPRSGMTSGGRVRRRVAWLVWAIGSAAVTFSIPIRLLTAQPPPVRTPPLISECSKALRDVARSIADGTRTFPLRRCGEFGIVALADALRAHRSVTDTTFWRRFRMEAWLSVGEPLLRSAEEVLTDSSASLPARVSAVDVLMQQVNPRESIGTFSVAELSDDRLDARIGWCSGTLTDAGGIIGNPRASAPNRVRAALDGAIGNERLPVELRRLVVCVRRRLVER